MKIIFVLSQLYLKWCYMDIS